MSDFNWLEWAKELISMGCEWLQVVDEGRTAYIYVNSELCVVHPKSLQARAYPPIGDMRLEYAICEAVEAENWSYQHRYYKNTRIHLWAVNGKARQDLSRIQALAMAYREALSDE